MADPVSPSIPPVAPPPHDWEVLSLSMSASAFGTASPASAPASVVCGCDGCTGVDSGNGVPHLASLLPVSHQENASELSSPGGASAKRFMEAEDPPSEEGRQSKPIDPAHKPDNIGKVEMEAEASGSGSPFENWKEALSAAGSNDVGVDVGKIGGMSSSDVEPFTDGWKPAMGVAFEGQYQEGAFSANEDTQSLAEIQKEMFMAGEEFLIKEDVAGEILAADPNVTEADKVLKKKPRKSQANGAWWKLQGSLWRAQSRKSSAMWSIAFAATVLGIAIIGHRWQRERYQNQQLRLELSAKDEKLNDLVYQVNRLREAITGRRRVPVIRTSSFSQFNEY